MSVCACARVRLADYRAQKIDFCLLFSFLSDHRAEKIGTGDAKGRRKKSLKGARHAEPEARMPKRH